MNNGVPTTVVSTPTGMIRPAGRKPDRKVGEQQQDRADQRGRSSARPGWPPVIRRAAKGAIRPTKPIAPQTETQAPTATDDRATTSRPRRRGG